MTNGNEGVTGGRIDEAQIGALVERFYARVRLDPMIGPVFLNAIDDWPTHLERLKSFWSSVLLGTGSYKGQPLAVHLRHADRIDRAAFSRWLEMWGETADEVVGREAAAVLREKAARIADSLHMGIQFARDSGIVPRRLSPQDAS